MRVLLVGGGGREHAIGKALVESGAELFAVMKNRNPGISRLSREYLLTGETEIGKIVEFANEKRIDMAVIGPEAPLAEGIVDELVKNGIGCVGPQKSPARLEWDKSWAREFMRENNIPGCPEFGVFDDIESAIKFGESLGEYVIKPSGLTGGKGVRVKGEHFSTVSEARDIMRSMIPSHRIVIEEKLIGEEFTLQGFVDGKNVEPSPCVQDHKRAFEGDKGPNTGGMGSYSDTGYLLPFMEKKDYDSALKIMTKTVKALKKAGMEYRGILYGQFMLTGDGVKLIEYNVRFGDPEAMNILPIMRTGFLEVCEGIVDGKNASVKFMDKATVCKYLVPAGYPSDPKSGARIEINAKEEENLKIFYASVDEREDGIYTTTSRSMALVGIGDDIYSAEERVERSISLIKGDLFYRSDIGKRELVEKRINNIKNLRRGS